MHATALLLTCLVLMPAPAYAQTSGQLTMRLEVLPAALRVTVTSSAMDFARQHANAGRVHLDPATGEISGKVSGMHRFGEVRLSGPENGAYAVAVSPSPHLRGEAGRVGFQLLWAHNANCAPGGFVALPARRSTEGSLGERGCSLVRFGGAIDLLGVPEGRYEGRLEVHIVSL